MARKAPTQRAYSMCLQHVQGEAGIEGKCSFIRADFHLNGAFQLNSLKLLAPPQNVSVSEQEVWDPSTLLTERGKALKRHAVGLNLTSSLRQSQTSVGLPSCLTFYLWSVGHSGYCSLYKTAQMLGLLNKLKC